MPYMAIELMAPKEPLVRKLAHDLESVFLVLLHIASFTCGPAGTSVGKVKISHRVAQWHHEPNIDILIDKKSIDIFYIHKSPDDRLTDYWLPIAPFIKELIAVVYPGVPQCSMKNEATFERFRDVLTRALNHCRTLQETPSNYAAIRPSVTSRKRPRNESTGEDHPAPKHLRTMSSELPHHPYYIVPYSQYHY